MAQIKIDAAGHLSKVDTTGDLVLLTQADYTILKDALLRRIRNDVAESMVGPLLITNPGVSGDNAVTVATFPTVLESWLSDPLTARVSPDRHGYTAAAAQTLLNVAQYVIGSNNLSVWVNGVKQMLSHGQYTETTATSITFGTPLNLNDQIEIEILP